MGNRKEIQVKGTLNRTKKAPGPEEKRVRGFAGGEHNCSLTISKRRRNITKVDHQKCTQEKIKTIMINTAKNSVRCYSQIFQVFLIENARPSQGQAATYVPIDSITYTLQGEFVDLVGLGVQHHVRRGQQRVHLEQGLAARQLVVEPVHVGQDQLHTQYAP